MIHNARLHGLGKAVKEVPGVRRLFPALRMIYYMYPGTGCGPALLRTPPGHFHSPIPNCKEVSAKSAVIFDRTAARCAGIDLREEKQLELLELLSGYYEDFPFTTTRSEELRYYYPNQIFSLADALIVYAMLRHFEPRNVIEVGSGFSSAAMLDVNDAFLDRSVGFTFIEPDPDRLLGLLTREDQRRHTIRAQQVQEIALEVFEALDAGDLLFIDSSHVAKAGSDLCYIVFEILPRLRPGVIVHFHDNLLALRVSRALDPRGGPDVERGIRAAVVLAVQRGVRGAVLQLVPRRAPRRSPAAEDAAGLGGGHEQPVAAKA